MYAISVDVIVRNSRGRSGGGGARLSIRALGGGQAEADESLGV